MSSWDIFANADRLTAVSRLEDKSRLCNAVKPCIIGIVLILLPFRFSVSRYLSDCKVPNSIVSRELPVTVSCLRLGALLKSPCRHVVNVPP